VNEGVSDLDMLLRTMQPALQPGHLGGYCKFDGREELTPGLEAFATYREAEGIFGHRRAQRRHRSACRTVSMAPSSRSTSIPSSSRSGSCRRC